MHMTIGRGRDVAGLNSDVLDQLSVDRPTQAWVDQEEGDIGRGGRLKKREENKLSLRLCPWKC